MTHVIAHRTVDEPVEALLGEGLAVCLDQAAPPVHTRAVTLLRNNQLIPLAILIGDTWFSYDPAVTYPESGSLVCWLMEQFCVETVKSLYTHGDLQTALRAETGLSLQSLESQWLAWLKDVY